MKKQTGMGMLLVFCAASFLFLQPAFGEDPVQWEMMGPAGLGGCIYYLTIDPTDDNVLYLSPDVGGLYRTMDGGKSWKSMSCVYEAGGNDTIYTTVAPSNPKVVYTFLKWEERGQSWRLSRSADRMETVEPVGPNGVTGPIAIDPADENIIYIGLNRTDLNAGKVFKTADGGKTWTNSFMGCSSEEEARQKNIRFGTGSSGAGSGALLIDPGSPKEKRILYGSGSFGVCKSIDGGNTWQEINNGLPHKNADKLALYYDKNTGKRTLYVTLTTIKDTCDGGIYKSIDEGATWQNASGNLTPKSFYVQKGYITLTIIVSSKNPDIAYYGCYIGDQGLLKTEDGGKSWNRVTFTGDIEYGGPPEKKNMEWKGEIWNWVGRGNLVNNGLVISQQNPEIVYYCDLHSMFKTTDGGKTWKQCYVNKLGENRWQTRGAEADLIFQILLSPYHKDRLYVAEQESALFCSFDGGKSFLNACLTLPHPDTKGTSHDRLSARSVAISPDNPDIVFAAGNLRYGNTMGDKYRSVIISRDGGQTWDRAGGAYPVTQGVQPTGMSVLPLRNKKVLLTNPPTGGLYMSEDEGENWKQIELGWDPKESFTFVKLYGSKLNSKRAYASARVWHRSTSWYCWARGLSTSKKLDRKVYGIYVSEDEGKTWRPLSEALEKVSVTDIAFSPDEKTFYATAENWDEGVKEEAGKISHNTGGVYKSEDGGKTWQRILSGAAMDVALNTKNSDIVYLVSDGVKNDETGWKGNGIMRSIDNGKTWERIGRKITPSVQCIAVNPHDTSVIYVGTRGAGAWKGIDKYVKETVEKKKGGIGNWLKNIFGGMVVTWILHEEVQNPPVGP